MTAQSNKLVGPLDILKLLDLLNSFEAGHHDGELTESTPRSEFVEAEVPAAVSVPGTPPASSPRDLTTDVDQTVENRFAAHVVYGMAKLTRS